MAVNEGLFDLSLFAESPACDRHFTIPHVPLPRQQHQGESLRQPRLRSHTVSNDYSNKPLPPLPLRRTCPKPKVSGSRGCDMDSRCILKRIQRVGSNEQPTGQVNTLLQRRNPTSPPQLTLSVPQTHPWNRTAASAMVWMPDEQMWLVAGEVEREINARDYSSPPAYTPPSYTPRAFTRSEPSSSIPPPFDLTPPMTLIQHQLQSLIHPPTERDEERLSPLFQEAMNSVPMVESEEFSSDQLTLDMDLAIERSLSEQSPRPQSAVDRSFTDVSPESAARVSIPVRSVSAGSRMSHARSDTSDTRSFYSAMSVDLSQPANSASRWAGLARRVAMREAAMD